jgi:hypothetical protein
MITTMAETETWNKGILQVSTHQQTRENERGDDHFSAVREIMFTVGFREVEEGRTHGKRQEEGWKTKDRGSRRRERRRTHHHFSKN